MTRTNTGKPEAWRSPLLLILILLVGLLFATLTLSAIREGSAPGLTPTLDVSAINTRAMSGERIRLTQTAQAWTPTPEPSPTSTSTNTPPPSPTPPRVPILRTGTGDAVFYPQKWIGPAVVRISYDGSGPLLVWTQNDNAEREDLLASTTGPYHGDSLIDFLGSQRTLRFEVRTGEAWQIEVLPLTEARRAALPGTISGIGDEAIVFDGSYVPDLMTVDASGATGSFTVWAFGQGREQVVVNPAPYSGTVALPMGTTALAVKAQGPWSLDITIR